jgi:peptide/nickel transport system permease protein
VIAETEEIRVGRAESGALDHDRVRPRSRIASIWRRFRRNRVAFGSLTVMIVIAALAILAPRINADVLELSPDAIDAIHRLEGSSDAHWLGTDEYGRDVLARLLAGSRISLTVGLLVVLVSSSVGLTVGLLAGFKGGIVDSLLMRITDTLLAMPTFYLILAAAAMTRVTTREVILFIGLTSWMSTARLVRAEVLSLKERDYVLAAYCSGARSAWIMVRHIAPGTIPVVTVAATLGVGHAILIESALSFLGVGIQPPQASWGNLLTEAQTYVFASPGLAIYPGLCIVVTVLALNFIGDGLREAVDPRFS